MPRVLSAVVCTLLVALSARATESGPRIAFATLWQGVVSGEIPIEVIAGPEVARVDLHLDGELFATLSAAPWRTTCDLGPELAPHELSAHAYDGEGNPVGETRQRLNLPRPNAELEILVTGRTVTLAWGATAGDAPKTIRASLDGTPISLPPNPTTFTLPPYEPQIPHVLRVEADFAPGLRASREMAIGDVLSADSQVSLTNVLVQAPRKNEEVQIFARGESARVVAVEEGQADLFAVVDPGAGATLLRIAQRAGGSSAPLRPGMRGMQAVSSRANTMLGRHHRLWIVAPTVVRSAAGRYELFPTSQELRSLHGGMLGHLVAAARAARGDAPRLADAVAIAGLLSGERGRRRAVLLVLDEDVSDGSSYSPAAVRAYLQRLRIPLVVWTTGKVTDAMREAWGSVTEVGNAARIERATRDLRTLLDRQRVAWVEGAFLPQELSVEGATEPQPDEELPVAEYEEEGIEEEERAEREELIVSTVAPPLLTARSFGPFSGSTDVRDEQLLARLSRLSAALPAAFSVRFGLSPAPAGSVFVFGRERDFRAWVREQHGVDDPRMEGFAASGTAMIYVGNHRGDEAGAMLVHEITHLLTRAAFGRAVPPWIEEGLAEELAMHRFLRDGQLVPDSIRVLRSVSVQSLSPLARGARMQRSVSGPGAALLRLAGGAIVPLPVLVDVSSEEFLAAEGRHDRYATAAFFIRFLLSTQPDRAERFRAFLLAGASGAPLDRAALETALQEPIAETDRKFVRWLRQLAMTPR